jgi:tyrosinase
MSSMDRRKFLGAALGSVGGLGLAACADTTAGPLAPPEEARADIDANGTYLRRNIYCLSATSYDVDAYKRGITTMQARNALSTSNPLFRTSWTAQANIHGTFSPIAGMIANACRHGNYFFLSWHRMYLYYFERIVRSASGRPNFALPYWGYSPSGNSYRALPVMFRTPTTGNVLYIPNRSTTINAGNLIAATVLDSGVAMSQVPFNSFSNQLEGTPHGLVHTAVGGPGGWMSLVETAARDPIFWLHHANIDRLWITWKNQAGRFNPSDSTWLNTTFNFYDEAGSTISMSGAQILDTVAQLRYRYTSCMSVSWEDISQAHVLNASALAIRDVIGPRPPRPVPFELAQVQVGVKLGPVPVEVPLVIPPELQEELRSFPDRPEAGNDIAVHLEHISLTREPGVFYEVYANLPEGETGTEYTSPNYVGNLDFFGVAAAGDATVDHSAMAMHSRRLSLLNVYAHQRSVGEWRDDVVRLTFIPRAYVEGENPAEEASDTQAAIGRISLRLE